MKEIKKNFTRKELIVVSLLIAGLIIFIGFSYYRNIYEGGINLLSIKPINFDLKIDCGDVTNRVFFNEEKSSYHVYFLINTKNKTAYYVKEETDKTNKKSYFVKKVKIQQDFIDDIMNMVNNDDIKYEKGFFSYSIYYNKKYIKEVRYDEKEIIKLEDFLNIKV